LQELSFEAAFDGAMTVDAMENIPPEDWPVVIANIRRALKPAGTTTSRSKKSRTTMSKPRSGGFRTAVRPRCEVR
jgi:hypothetical protein